MNRIYIYIFKVVSYLPLTFGQINNTEKNGNHVQIIMRNQLAVANIEHVSLVAI